MIICNDIIARKANDGAGEFVTGLWCGFNAFFLSITSARRLVMIDNKLADLQFPTKSTINFISQEARDSPPFR